MREIRVSIECNECVERLGGWKAVDVAWSVVADAISRNPYACPLVEYDNVASVRYIITDPIGTLPALVWSFEIENDRAISVRFLEEYEPY